MQLTVVIILSVILIPFLYILKKAIENVVKGIYIQKMPGPPKANIFFGNMRPLHAAPERTFQVVREWGLKYYPIYKLWISTVQVANIVNPDDFELVMNNMQHLKKGKSYDLLHRWLGSGLLTSTGQKWQTRRKILTPSFHFNILQNFLGVFNEESEKIVEVLKNEEGNSFTDISPIVAEFTLRTIGQTSMGTQFDFKTEKERMYRQSFRDLIQILMERLFRPWLFYDCFYIFSPLFYREMKLIKILHDFTTGVIKQRQVNIKDNVSVNHINESQDDEVFVYKKRRRLAMLDLLLTVKNEEGLIDDDGIREEVDTFMFEGHDTTSAAISFALMLIACHQDVQEKLVVEMREVLADVKENPTFKELQDLQYMDRVIKEVLRLYPSVHYISREAGEDLVTSGGYKIKKGTLIQLHIYDLHHNPNVFEDPEKFDPDRFLPENTQNRHPFAYLPFSAGPRNCIGQRFAMLEIKTFLCHILRHFVLKPVDTPESVVMVLDIVLCTKDGIKVKFERRDRGCNETILAN